MLSAKTTHIFSPVNAPKNEDLIFQNGPAKFEWIGGIVNMTRIVPWDWIGFNFVDFPSWLKQGYTAEPTDKDNEIDWSLLEFINRFW